MFWWMFFLFRRYFLEEHKLINYVGVVRLLKFGEFGEFWMVSLNESRSSAVCLNEKRGDIIHSIPTWMSPEVRKWFGSMGYFTYLSLVYIRVITH